MKVKEIMTAPVISAPTSMASSDVAALLRSRRISAVPVTDADGAVIGLVSEYDLLSRSGATAGDIMTAAVITVTEDTEVDDVRSLLVDRRIRRVPVVAGGKLVGIVSRSDIVGTMAWEWVCEVCGESWRGDSPPEACLKCASGPERFVRQTQLPGT
jgi:CBS domain-containing protein